jgi:hypothetical protein
MLALASSGLEKNMVALKVKVNTLEKNMVALKA